MLKSVYIHFVNKHRGYKYEKKLERYKLRSGSGGGNTVIIGYATAIAGYFAGKRGGQDIRAFFNSTDSLFDAVVRRFHGPLLFVVPLLIGIVAFLPIGVFISETVYLGVVLFVAIGPVTHANYLARRDFKTTKQLRENAGQLRPETVQTAFQNIHHHQQPVRESAFQVLQQSFQGSPGAAVKTLPGEPDAISKSLRNCLDYDDLPTVRGSLVCLMWFSRDFPNLLAPESKRLARYLDSDHSGIQVQATHILGNIGASKPEQREQYATALAPSVKDLDAEVRGAAAISLGKLPCEKSMQMLKHLSEDSDPEVRQRANTAIQNIASS